MMRMMNKSSSQRWPPSKKLEDDLGANGRIWFAANVSRMLNPRKECTTAAIQISRFYAPNVTGRQNGRPSVNSSDVQKWHSPMNEHFTGCFYCTFLFWGRRSFVCSQSANAVSCPFSCALTMPNAWMYRVVFALHLRDCLLCDAP